MPRRARISDNDPLNKTEKVLERFEQISQQTSEPVEHTFLRLYRGKNGKEDFLESPSVDLST